MRPLYVTPYGRGGASSRARVYDWLSWTALDAEVSNYLGTRDLRPSTIRRSPAGVARAEARLRVMSRARRRHVLLHRDASPFSRGGIERRLLRTAEFSVYDFDDALQWEDPRTLARRLFSKRAKCRTAVQAADRVIAGNEVLADWASSIAADVIVIPTCVDPTSYPMKSDYEISSAGPRIGWLGSPSTEQYLLGIADALLEVHRRTEARLTVISSGRASLGPLDSIVDRVEWDQTTFAAGLTAVDIAIAPLDDSPWARGKCAYKMLQYAAIGLPMIASPVGANAVASSRFGSPRAVSADDWVELLTCSIFASISDRRRQGTAARRAVESHYSFASWEQRWLAAQGLDKQSSTA